MSGSLVLLGVPDDPVYIPAEEGVTKIGGTPRWLCGEPESLKQIKCSKCKCSLELLVSADCPVSDDFDRIIYFFICPKCGQEGHVYRQKKVFSQNNNDNTPLFTSSDLVSSSNEAEADSSNKESTPVAPPAPSGSGDILAALDAFKNASSSNQNQNQNKKKKARKPQREKGKWPAFYIDTFEEPEAEVDPNLHYEISTSPDASSMQGIDEGAANDPVIAITPELVEFNEHMSRCPDQVLRYCRFGEPLLQDKTDVSNIPKCPKCGANRIFEFEILPTIIYTLDPESDMDFGPILVYTCSQDCGREGTCDEHCIICSP
ncbi:hypothetical protein M9Y10_022242 [Tritrichomonas musculus]|uniref:Programmed cell death protein 2 C-terminal domain-containing protein n=1 Tax=Tritrichomonas musculus TaxID=1915356 RepID=A0ABR2KRP9_9EUKA